jgi:hypothetical protein
MRCQRVDADIQCRFDATRRVLVVGGDPPDPDLAGSPDRLHGPGLQGTRPRPEPVDAAAAAPRSPADRRAPEALHDRESVPGFT